MYNFKSLPGDRLMFSERLQAKTRRDFLRLSSAGIFGAGLSGWMSPLAAAAANGKTKSCILLWMEGGPSHKDTFDLKPDSKGAGSFKPIKTSAPGIEISEHLPNVAKLMNHGAVIRSMTTGEGAHGRARYYMHTGYKEGVGGLTYPSIGSIVSQELGSEAATVPNYVTINGRSFGSGFLGPKHQPLIISDPLKGLEDLKPLVNDGQFDKRVNLLNEMEQSFLKSYQGDSVTDHKTNYARAVKLMQSKEVKAFDLTQEAPASREKYGTGKFADGVLMARRLVEVGVPFVEVNLGGWDTHENVFERVKTLSGQVDLALSALINDLKARRLLDSTLVIWMGEFGRTPNINTRGGDKPGRDHYAKAWSLAMFGGGIKGGQVIGATDKEGAVVADRPVTALDFMSTVCGILGVDSRKENVAANARPIRIVDKGAKPITQLLPNGAAV